jgi:hypothetical protein
LKTMDWQQSQWPAAAASFMYNSALSQPTPQPRILALAADANVRPAARVHHDAESAERHLHALHVALSACREQKNALEQNLQHSTRHLQTHLSAVTEERDALQMRLMTSQALISRLQDREDRAGTHSILTSAMYSARI